MSYWHCPGYDTGTCEGLVMLCSGYLSCFRQVTGAQVDVELLNNPSITAHIIHCHAVSVCRCVGTARPGQAMPPAYWDVWLRFGISTSQLPCAHSRLEH